MSNNAPDYGDNLVFPPQQKQSQFCVKKSDENVTQTDLCITDDIQFPPRHDKTAYELQIENNKLREEKSEIEIELKNTERTCYGWQRLVESLEEQNNQLKVEVKRLREALEYYADESNYSHYDSNNEIIWDENCGNIARKALNEGNEGR